MATPTQRDQDHGPEDQVDKEGYDETQRAEIIETEGRGPKAGVIQTGIAPDPGGPDPDEDEIEDDEDALDIVEDTDAPFRDLADLDGEEPADLEREDTRLGVQGNENATNRKDTQNTTGR